MPKVSVYLPDELYRKAREEGLSVSALAQEAIAAQLRRVGTDRWIAGIHRRASRTRAEVDTGALMVDVRDGFGA